MSTKPTNAHVSKDAEHGSTRSYIIGFLLSLIFTAIPYYMVVNKSVSGTALLVTILAFGVLQMLVQVLFFLHLGRGPKPLYNVVFLIFTVTTILVVVGGSIFIMTNLHYNMSPEDMSKKLIEKEGIHQLNGEKTGACEGQYTNHRVTIKDGVVRPIHVSAKLCDTLSFIIEEGETFELAFGTNPNRETYAGETGIRVRKNRGNTIILNQAGTYRYYDPNDPNIVGDFTVEQ